MQELDLKSALETNVVKIGTMSMEAFGNRLIVIQDEFRSGYECQVCQGKQFIACDSCAGTGKSAIVTNGRCTRCEGKKVLLCPECRGKGGVLIVPEKAELRPTTGTIVSVGDEITRLKRGQAVIYPSFAGHFFELSAKDVHGNDIQVGIVILTESDVISVVSGHLELKRVKKSLHTAA